MTTTPRGSRSSSCSSRSPSRRVAGAGAGAGGGPAVAQGGLGRGNGRAGGGARAGSQAGWRHEDALPRPTVDLQARLIEDEVLRVGRGGLRLAEGEVAPVAQREGEQLEGAFLQL